MRYMIPQLHEEYGTQFSRCHGITGLKIHIIDHLGPIQFQKGTISARNDA